MGAIRLAVLAVLVVMPEAGQARAAVDQVAQWRPLATEASLHFGVPVDWIERVIRAESGGQTMIAGHPIRSKAGAIGLMQVMPATWAAMRSSYRLGADPDDPHDNIAAGTAFLRLMYDRFGYPCLFAAYNAGPARYAAYLAGQSRLPAETVAYLGGITGGRSNAAATVMPPRQLLFALRRDLAEPKSQPALGAASDGLFAIRQAAR